MSFLYDPEGCVAARLRDAGVVRVMEIQPPRAGELPVPGAPAHAADRLAQPLRAWGVSVPDPAVPSLAVPERLRDAGRRLLPAGAGQVVTLHPGSGSPGKNWPLANFVAIADRLRAAGCWCPVMVLGEAELDWRASPDVLGGHTVMPACELEQLAGVFAGVALHIGNDSGITHLAAAVGAPTVALFGPTDPAQWGPRGARVRIVRATPTSATGLAALPVDTVWQHAMQAVAAS